MNFPQQTYTLIKNFKIKSYGQKKTYTLIFKLGTIKNVYLKGFASDIGFKIFSSKKAIGSVENLLKATGTRQEAVQIFRVSNERIGSLRQPVLRGLNRFVVFGQICFVILVDLLFGQKSEFSSKVSGIGSTAGTLNPKV